MKVNKFYNVSFAGSILKVKYVGKSELNDGTKCFMFTDGIRKYPIRKNNICENLKQ
jgi:hypothetical protein